MPLKWLYQRANADNGVIVKLPTHFEIFKLKDKATE
jgi:hypothetical protein